MGRGVARLVLRAHGRRTPEFIVLSDCGRCSFHVRNRGPIQATPKSKGTSKLGWTIMSSASLDARTRGSTRLSPTEVGEESLEEGGMKADHATRVPKRAKGSR